MENNIKGLYVKNYKDLDVNALEEIIQLNNQLEKSLEQIIDCAPNVEDMITMLKYLIQDTESHTEYCVNCQTEILADMENN